MGSLMTLHDVYEMFDRFVPDIARSIQVRRESEFGSRHASWWPAHELGHLAVAKPSEVFCVEFAIGDDFPGDADVTDHYRMCKERAAMHVSGQILRMCGEAGACLVQHEIDNTDEETLEWPTYGLVTRMLRSVNATKLPRTKRRLEGYFSAKLEAAERFERRKSGAQRKRVAKIGADVRAGR